ncbi:uncharacterized protein B0H64DRAFT_406285 [Chaetomium fimeti]|uniref:Uncharacterized protein n=1 Tax=Chaetomium fimeti TaxID=1854472 RepID=A0AAE0LP79_9PEZI|nr:hypothetical protein B0H64DRAFT_406285 [Chaetomium fimeti]
MCYPLYMKQHSLGIFLLSFPAELLSGRLLSLHPRSSGTGAPHRTRQGPGKTHIIREPLSNLSPLSFSTPELPHGWLTFH